MSQLLVITFPKRETAGQAGERLKGLEGAHGVDIRDMAIVEKDADGEVHVHHGIDKPTVEGAVGGGLLGLLLGLVFFPLGGLVLGAAAGAFVGRSLQQHVDGKLVEDVTADLGAGTSALFVVGAGSPAAVVGALEPFKGTVYQTTLDPDVEQRIQAALEEER